MNANKDFYLTYRATFLQLGYFTEVKKIDNHFGIVIVYDKHGNLKNIL